MTTFRIATINVHSFNDPLTYKNNIEKLVLILKPYHLDLIAVQEIADDNDWSIFCERLSLPHRIFGSSAGKYFGNGIASHYPIKSYSNQQSSLTYQGERRSLLQCCLNGDHSFFKDRIFGVTHLDYINEYNRLKQIEEFNSFIDNIDILMGDMNALTRNDYSDYYYQKNLVKVRENSQWEKPCFDLTEFITDQWNFQDAFKQINPDAKDEQVVTCRYHTRIDYIYLRPRINDSWILKECSIINMENATDHNAVFAVFEQKNQT
jgi:endonuclease/exonuclease/phosphatase family metal-dependent hydrolase